MEQRVSVLEQQRPWFAIQVRTSTEKSVAALLQHAGYESYVPLDKSRRRWSDRIKQVEVALFPGYLFCRLDLQNRLPILQTPGVIHIVGIGKTPMPVDEAEIAAIQRVLKNGVSAQPWPFLQIGQRVQIRYGPLCGLTGIIVDLKSEVRLVLSVTLLRRSVAVEVDRDCLSQLDRLDSVAGAVGPERPLICHARNAQSPRYART
jgi:transcription antitermination factor NusG